MLLEQKPGRTRDVTETIVLLHGLGRTTISMLPLAAAARLRGFDVVPWGYRSRTFTIAEHAERLHADLEARSGRFERLHFVTHSLGGIIVRQMLANHPIVNCGRTVMLAPPNRGSEVVDRLRPFRFAHRILGRSGLELGTEETSTPNTLPPVGNETGVIAGSRQNNVIFSSWIGAPNDGKVAITRAAVEGMRDFLVLPHSHTFILWAPDTIRQTLYFLEHGKFDTAA